MYVAVPSLAELVLPAAAPPATSPQRRYDAVLLDQFGVLHDGRRAFPFALHCVERLHRHGVACIVLSNTSRTQEHCLAKLETFGYRRDWFAGAVTSGQLAQDALMRRARERRQRRRRQWQERERGQEQQADSRLPAHESSGERARVGGDDDDDEEDDESSNDIDAEPAQSERVLHTNWAAVRGSVSMPAPYVGVGDAVDKAAFVLTHGTEAVTESGSHGDAVSLRDTDALYALLRRAAQRRLPLWCANPDMVTVDGGVNRVMPGTLAAVYEGYLREHATRADRAGGIDNDGDGGGDTTDNRGHAGHAPVTRFGKPDRIPYDAAMQLLNSVHALDAGADVVTGGGRACGPEPASAQRARQRRRVLAVGDSLSHDILGGQRAGVDTLFIAGGIHGHEHFALPSDADSAAALVAANENKRGGGASLVIDERAVHAFLDAHGAVGGERVAPPTYCAAYLRW